MAPNSPASLTDEELFQALKLLVARERESTVDVLRHLAELDAREAHLKAAFPSRYIYCIRELGYSEGAAYRRIRAARCARAFPRIYILLRRGRTNLTTISLLAPHLTRANHRRLLDEAAGKSRYEVERMVALLAPRPDPRETMRPLRPAPVAAGSGTPASEREGWDLPLPSADAPAPEQMPATATNPIASASPADQPPEPAPSSRMAPRSEAAAPPPPCRVEFRFSAPETLVFKVRRAREVLWHKHPAGRLEDIFDEALESLLDSKDPGRRLARLAARRPRRAAAPTTGA